MEGDISLSFGVQSAPEKSRRDEREKHEGKAAGTARPRRRRLPGAPPCVFGVGLGRRPEGRGRGLESGQRDVNIIGAALTPNSPKVERNHLTAGQAVGSVSHGPRPALLPSKPAAMVAPPPPPFPESPLHGVLAPRRAPDPLAHFADVGSLCLPPARPSS